MIPPCKRRSTGIRPWPAQRTCADWRTASRTQQLGLFANRTSTQSISPAALLSGLRADGCYSPPGVQGHETGQCPDDHDSPETPQDRHRHSAQYTVCLFSPLQCLSASIPVSEYRRSAPAPISSTECCRGTMINNGVRGSCVFRSGIHPEKRPFPGSTTSTARVQSYEVNPWCLMKCSG